MAYQMGFSGMAINLKHAQLTGATAYVGVASYRRQHERCCRGKKKCAA